MAQVEEAARERFPARPLLARGLGQAALVEFLLRAAELGDRPDPVAPLRRLWRTGQVVCVAGPDGVTLGLPPP